MTALPDADLPLSDWRSTAPHSADQCQLDLCSYCGCCSHGKFQHPGGCKVDSAPYGMRCPNSDCGCEGRA